MDDGKKPTHAELIKAANEILRYCKYTSCDDCIFAGQEDYQPGACGFGLPPGVTWATFEDKEKAEV